MFSDRGRTAPATTSRLPRTMTAPSWMGLVGIKGPANREFMGEAGIEDGPGLDVLVGRLVR